MGDARTGGMNRHVGDQYQHHWLRLEKQTQSPAWMFELSTQEWSREKFLGSDTGCDGVWRGHRGRVTTRRGGPEGEGTQASPSPPPPITPTSQPGSIYISCAGDKGIMQGGLKAPRQGAHFVPLPGKDGVVKPLPLYIKAKGLVI